MLGNLNHWHSPEAFERQGVKVDNVSIYQVSVNSRRDQPSAFEVSNRCYTTDTYGNVMSQQYWGSTFSIRDSLGNPTPIGRMIGIGTRDKKITIFSPKGQAIQYFLNRVAWIEAHRLTYDRHSIKDKTGYKVHNNRREMQPEFVRN